MVTTIIMAIPIALSIHIVRGNASKVKALWRAGKWYEKVAMCLMFVPLPGPLDEMIALWAMRRITKRIRS